VEQEQMESIPAKSGCFDYLVVINFALCFSM